MLETIIADWLSDSDASELKGNAKVLKELTTELLNNEELIRALYHIFENYEEYAKLASLSCNQLFVYYQCRNVELKQFVLQYIPLLIYAYLANLSGDKSIYRTVEALLIGIYNLEVVDDSGQPTTVSFRIPSLAQASIYHEPMNLAPSFLSENALRRLEECNSKLVSWGPLPLVESINAQNRLGVMTALMFVYNSYLNKFTKSALRFMCTTMTRLVEQGFKHPFNDSGTTLDETPPVKLLRIGLSASFLIEILHATYYALYNGQQRFACRTLDVIQHRAMYESYADVQLLTNAIQNSFSNSHTGEKLIGAMSNTSFVASQSASGVSINKSMITNASFRTKKLPEDIPIQKEDTATANQSMNDPKNLMSITEEQEDDGGEKTSRSKISPANLAAAKSILPNFSNLGKMLNKDKDAKDKDKTRDFGERTESIVKKINTSASKLVSRNSIILQNGDLEKKELGDKINGLNLDDDDDDVSVSSSATVSNDIDNGGKELIQLISLHEKDSRIGMQVSSV